MASVKIELTKSIVDSIPELNDALQALCKMRADLLTDIPEDSIRYVLTNTSTTPKLEIRFLKDGTTWTKIGSIDIDAAKCGGYAPTMANNANTIAVRDANKAITATSFLGKATSAGSADTAGALTNVNPVAMGGTGANNATTARTNLDVPSNADFSALSGTVSGQGTTIADAQSRGQIGEVVIINQIVDFNTFFEKGSYVLSYASHINAPFSPGAWTLENLSYVGDYSPDYMVQRATSHNGGLTYVRYKGSASIDWKDWQEISNHGVLNDSSVEFFGGKTFNGPASPDAPIILRSGGFDVVTVPPQVLYCTGFQVEDKNRVRVGGLQLTRMVDDTNKFDFFVDHYDENMARCFTFLSLAIAPDGVAYAEAPTPLSSSNSNQIATTEWTRTHMSNGQQANIVASNSISTPAIIINGYTMTIES